ncbi:MAG: c-type cytochrome [Candidatus Acidiferrales bacterium]
MKTRRGHILFEDARAICARLRCGAILRAAAFFVSPLVIVAALMFSGSRAWAQSETTAAKSGQTHLENAENGKKLFAKVGCYECHGREGQGGGMNGPRLAPDPLPLAVIRTYIRHPMGEMPPFTEKVLSEKDLDDIYAFLASQPQPTPVKSIPILNH